MGERSYRAVLLVLGHGVFLSLLVLAWKYALLRATFGDTAFQVFQWISQPGWDIEAHRYTAIIPQAAVKFFALFGPDLETLLYVASLVHVLVGYGVFLLCAHVWKSPVAAFGCALAAVLCSRLAFYSPVLEANYLLCYPFLFIGYIERCVRDGTFTPGPIAFSGLLALVALIVHPAGWMVMLFATVFMSAIGWLPRRPFAWLGSLMVLWPVLARWIFPPTGYEMEQYDAVGAGLRQLGDFALWGSWDFLAIHTFSASTTYLPALAVLILVVAGWIASGEWKTGFLTLAGALAFLFVFLVTFHSGNSAIMQDRGVLPVATILSLSVSALFLRLRAGHWRVVSLALAAVVLFVKARDVSFASRGFVKQLAAAEALIMLAEEQGIPRGIVDCQRLRDRDIDISWAFPVETLLRSAVRGKEHTHVLVCSDNLPASHMLASGQVQILQFVWAVDKNGNRYFQRAVSPYARVVQP